VLDRARDDAVAKSCGDASDKELARTQHLPVGPSQTGAGVPVCKDALCVLEDAKLDRDADTDAKEWCECPLCVGALERAQSGEQTTTHLVKREGPLVLEDTTCAVKHAIVRPFRCRLHTLMRVRRVRVCRQAKLRARTTLTISNG
jgi:hypothetical protein